MIDRYMMRLFRETSAPECAIDSSEKFDQAVHLGEAVQELALSGGHWLGLYEVTFQLVVGWDEDGRPILTGDYGTAYPPGLERFYAKSLLITEEEFRARDAHQESFAFWSGIERSAWGLDMLDQEKIAHWDRVVTAAEEFMPKPKE